MKPTLASSGQQALAVLESPDVLPFAVILLDYHMPGMDGIAVAQAIKTRPECAAAKILMLSSGGGEGEAERARRAGITVCVFKPFKQSELLAAMLTALGKTTQNVERRRHQSAPRTGEAAPSLHILLAEDNRVNQMFAVRLLEKEGHTVVAVGNGREAADAIEKQDFDLALLDVQMPVMDGLEAAGLIRQKEEEAGSGRLPIIAITAHAMRGDRERCLAAGMDGYVSKPINKRELLETIETLALAPSA